ncbi:uncharacterized protein B0P05DRAFT_130077 [Gilbertella persicaria]|uniref:uncharacterized protein n=1 Tax=Gilbertella persicaria TaxID=101096 RepID=UPI00221E5646|nr:uncharacterized protein B0P05DRAFT_130077 [Gilbertella persicaria]KAI8077386.1 hypothetical protein B0P05DRAFT_130077 [Gilbertella persicaria]
MFLNSIYTDGYTCRVSFCRKVHSISPNDKVSLKVDDFTSEEVDRYFRPCTVDPNRSDVFISYHGKNDLRRLSTADYYNMNGTVNRQKLEQDRKKRLDIEQIETHFHSPKTAKLQYYTEYVMYALQHFRALANFYGFNTAKIKGAATKALNKQLKMQSTFSLMVQKKI